MTNSVERKIPSRIKISKLVQSRYAQNGEGGRPANWDERHPGIDIVADDGGETIKLASDGQQSSPKAGWVITLLGGTSERGYTWTLYGMPKQ